MTELVWHLARQGQQFGPYTWPQIQLMAREGYIQPGDLLWGPSLPQWTPAGRIQGLALPSPAAPAPPRPAVGAPVPPSAAPAYPPPAPPPAPVPPRIPPPAAPAAPAPAAGFAPSPAAPKRSGRSCLVIGIVLLALALLAGGIAALIWWAPWQDASGGAGDPGRNDTWTEPAAADFPTASVVPGDTAPESSGSVELGADRTGVALGDGTGVNFPALPGGDSLRLTLERRPNDVALDVEGLQTTGSLRVVTVDAANLASPDTAAACAPVITIPAKEVGAIAPGSLLLARLGDIRLGDEIQSGRLNLLPLRRQLDGRYAARDPFFPLLPVFQSPPAARTPASTPSPLRAMLRPAGRPGPALALGLFMPDLMAAPAASPTARANAIQYAVVTYQQSINWRREPQLVRMAPTWGKPERRQPLSQLSNLQR